LIDELGVVILLVLDIPLKALAGILAATPPPVKYLTVKVVLEGAIP
jgi:hypothetical protein